MCIIAWFFHVVIHIMSSLNFRDIKTVCNIPLRDFEYKLIKIGNGIFAVFEDGGVWDIGLERWREPEIDKDGYRILHLGNRSCKLHRLVLMVFDRAPNYGEQGRHLDGDPSNNHRVNLRWGSGRDNWSDRRNHGREGAEWRRLLTNEQALAIFNDTRPERDIAKDYGIQRICVVLIKEKQTYKDIHNELYSRAIP